MLEQLLQNSKYKELINTPILDIPSTDGWKNVPIIPQGEDPLVPVDIYNTPEDVLIYPDTTYFGKLESSPYEIGQLKGSMIVPFARKSGVEKLYKFARELPKGVYLVAQDFYRTVEVQEALYNFYLKKLTGIHPDWSQDKLEAETQKYVSKPSYDPERPPPHITGLSFDLTLAYLPGSVFNMAMEYKKRLADLINSWKVAYINERFIDTILRGGKTLSFGVPFDWGGEEAALGYFEDRRNLTEMQLQAKGNRRFFIHLAKEAGLMPYEHEIWHLNAPEGQMGARAKGLRFALAGAASLTDEDRDYNTVMEQNHFGLTFHSKEKTFPGLQDFFGFTSSISREFGDPRSTSFDKAEIIAPKG